ILFILMLPLPPGPTLFPYTTLFRSKYHGDLHDRCVSSMHIDRVQSEFLCADRPPCPAGCGSGWCAVDCDGVYQRRGPPSEPGRRSEEHTSELQSRFELVCRLLLEQT